jgi:hypothetical protein
MYKPEADTAWMRRYNTQQTAVLDQMERVSRALEDRGQNAILKETAILEALAMDASSALVMAAAERVGASFAKSFAMGLLGDKIEGLAGLMASSERDLAQHVHALTVSTDANAIELARWTKVMAWATITLAVFAIVQVVVAIIAIVR